MRSPHRLGDDSLDHAEVEAMGGVEPERGGRLLRLRGIAPEDRSTPLGRDHRVDRVLLHQDTVCDGDRNRATRAAFADHDGDSGYAKAQHHGLRSRDCATLPVLLGRDPREGSWRVDESDQREPVPLGENPLYEAGPVGASNDGRGSAAHDDVLYSK